MNENNNIQSELSKAVGDLEAAKHELAGALAEERHAIAEIDDAERRIEQIADELAKQSKIKVNGRDRTIEGHKISFEEVVQLAFPSGPTKPNTKFTVTYRNAAQSPAMGEMDPGQTVKVKHGQNPQNETIFNVTETVLS